MLQQSGDVPRRPLTHAERRRRRKMQRKAPHVLPRPVAATPRRGKDPDRTILSKRIRQEIDRMIRMMERIGQIDTDVLDYRFWECIRCRWNPRRMVEWQGRRVRVYDWWRTVHADDREKIVEYSRAVGRGAPDISEERFCLWAKVRG